MDLWKKDVSGKGNSQCKGLEAWEVWESVGRAVWKGHRGGRVTACEHVDQNNPRRRGHLVNQNMKELWNVRYIG